jgi:hypothetical protein
LVGQDAADVPLDRLAGEHEGARLVGGRMAAIHRILIDQEAQVPPGLDELVFPSVVGFAGRRLPGPVRLLLADELLHLGQLPDPLERTELAVQQVPLDEVGDGRVAR